MESKLNSIVLELYRTPWNDFVANVRSNCVESNLEEILEVLIISEGWRERCVAVRIILTYSLFSYIPKLVSTFKANPEAYTCSGFIILLEQSEHEDKLELLDFMYSCCFDDDYGVKLKKRIQESIDNINNA